ncbi:MAG: inverse autotransporter beta domain-containing protein [Candidatus Omnitrophota bacterium]
MYNTKQLYGFFIIFFVILFSFASFQPCLANDLLPDDYPAQLRLCSRNALDAKTQWYYTDLFLPLYTCSGSRLFGTRELLFFLNPKFTASDLSTDEENLGLGLRYLSSDTEFGNGFILGVNVFYDSKYSSNGVRHYQTGYGAELLTKWIDLRANYYNPATDVKTAISDYQFAGQSLRQYLRFEEAVPGYDIEAGVMIPYISNFLETRISIASYKYTSTISADVKGSKIRLEITPSQYLAFQIESKDDKSRGSDVFIEGRITIPFGLGNESYKKPRHKSWKNFFLNDDRPRKLIDRMTDPVVRDLDIITAEKDEYRKIHDIIFVNNSNDADGLEDGTFEHPHNNLSEAFTNPNYGNGIWIYVQKGDGTSTGYTGTYTLNDQSVLWGEGYRYLDLGGGGYPIIDGGAGANVITLGKDNKVMGLQIQNGNRGIYGANCGTVEIRNNVITTNGLPFGTGLDLVCNAGSTVSATIANNTINSNTGNGLTLKSENFSSFTAVITNNTFNNNTASGIFLTSGGGAGTPGDTSTLTCTFLNNSISTNNASGLNIQGNWSSTLSASFSRNIFYDNNLDGLQIDSGVNFNLVMDLGNGSLGSAGYNSIYDNGILHIDNNTTWAISAENNWWGQFSPTDTYFDGTVDYTPYLSSNPN